MSSPGKRSYSPTGYRERTKKPKHTTLGSGSCAGNVNSGLSIHARYSQLSDFVDLTDDQPMVDADSVSGPSTIPSIQIDLTGGNAEVSEMEELCINSSRDSPVDTEPLRRGTTDIATPDATTQETTISLPIDYACFGLLCMQATCSGEIVVPSKCTPVALGLEKDTIRLYVSGTKTRIGIVVSKELSYLTANFKVILTAKLCGKRLKPIVVKQVGEHLTEEKTLVAKFCSVRIVVYAPLREKDTIGNILAERNLFLQHPSQTEIDRAVKYVNPHYLLPPGQDMPPIEELNSFTCCESRDAPSASRDTLEENEKNEVLRIFDNAFEFIGEAAIEPSSRLSTELKRHQIQALVMMIEKEAGIYDRALFPTIWKTCPSPTGRDCSVYKHIVTNDFSMSCPPPMAGGILADEMGLGKTLSALSLICHFLDLRINHPELNKIPKATLIVTPKSTIYGWESQIKTHIHPTKISWIIYHGPRRQEVVAKLSLYDIVLTTYETLRSDSSTDGPLYKQEWGRLILDEAHKIRNQSSRIFKNVCAVHASNRWCLTGTPIQNSLDDFGALLSFLKIPHLESKNAFDRFIANPIKNNKKDGIKTLRDIVAATSLRRTKAEYVSALNLPQKVETIQDVELGCDERRLYEFFKRFSHLTAASSKPSKKKTTTNILVLISMLRRICDHGEELLPEPAVKAWKNKDPNQLTLDILKSGVRKCASCDSEIEELDSIIPIMEEMRCGHILCETCLTDLKSTSNEPTCSVCENKAAVTPSDRENSGTVLLEDDPATLKRIYSSSAKIEALVRNIKKRQTISSFETLRPKAAIFSHWTKMLDLIGNALTKEGFLFHRIDGQSSLSQRKDALERFSNDPECNVMLATIGAAGEGIDLTAANSVHIVEPHWNPMAEAQAIDRVHRIGQQRDIEVIKYIVSDSIETYIRWVQNEKKRLIKDSLSTSEDKTDEISDARWNKLLEHLSKP